MALTDCDLDRGCGQAGAMNIHGLAVGLWLGLGCVVKVWTAAHKNATGFQAVCFSQMPVINQPWFHLRELRICSSFWIVYFPRSDVYENEAVHASNCELERV